MRVTFVLPTAGLAGGIRIIAQNADWLRQLGHTVVLVSLPPRTPSLRRKAVSLLKGRGWPATPRSRPSHLDNFKLDHRIIAQYRPITNRDVPDADVVIATWWETAEWVARLAPEKGAKAYFIQQYEANFGMPEDRVAATWRLPMQKIVCARWLADLARDRFQDPDAICVRNGLNVELFNAPERGRQPRPTVGMLYVPMPSKGPDVAFAVIERVRSQIPNLLVKILSAQPPAPAYPLPPDVEFLQSPSQTQIRDLYASCDVWLSTSRSEGYHLPPHEAMGCRCPVVSTRVGGPDDYVHDGENGFLVDVEDVEALADRLIEVIRMSEPEWKRFSEAAHTTANEHTVADAAAEFEHALETTIERDRAGKYREIEQS